jgi:hypothetical protein
LCSLPCPPLQGIAFGLGSSGVKSAWITRRWFLFKSRSRATLCGATRCSDLPHALTVTTASTKPRHRRFIQDAGCRLLRTHLPGTSVNKGMKVRAGASKSPAPHSAQGTQRRHQRRVWLPLVASRSSTSSSALCGTCLRGSGLCGNNGTHAYRSTLRADDAGNIQGISGVVLVPPLSGGA